MTPRLVLAALMLLTMPALPARGQIVGNRTQRLELKLTVTTGKRVDHWRVREHSIPNLDTRCADRATDLLRYAKRRLPKSRVTGEYACIDEHVTHT